MVTLMENENPKTVCCLTSYPKRIKNCYRVMKSLLENTIVPDRIYLTLARPQFKNDLDDLPPLLRELVIEDQHVFINWVEVDTRIMKKVIPVLPFLDDNDIIFPCDDDILYPTDYIESRLADFKAFGGVPLTGCETQENRTLFKAWGIPSSMGLACVFQKRHVENIEKFVDREVMNANNSDGVYSMVEWLNDYTAHDVTKYGMEWLRENCTFNETSPSRENGAYLFGNDILEVFRKRVCELTGMDIFDEKSALCSRGFFAQ